MVEPRIDIGSCIRSWRTARGLSQNALADRMGTVGNMIGVYERGEVSPTIHQLERISEALRLELRELLAGPPPAPGRGASRPWTERATDDLVCPIPYAARWRGEPLNDADVLLWPVSRTLIPHDGCVVTRIADDAMHPFLLRGDAVVINPDAHRPRSGSLVLLEAGRQVHVRRFLVLNRQKSFEPFNPLYPTLEPGPGLRVLGGLVALIQRSLQDASALKMGWRSSVEGS